MGTGGPTVYALLGNPVEHSRSPALHNAAFAALGLDAVYLARRVEADAARQLLIALARAGGGGNVTLPHKQLVVGALDVRSPAVQQTGACNTFWLGADGVHGDNTDVQGFSDAAAHHGVQLRDARVLLLGAGGSAAAVIAALLNERADRITILNRTPERAEELLDRYQRDPRLQQARTLPDEPWDIVVNATSLGLRTTDPHPLPLDRLPDDCALLDLVYAPGGTAWVRAARARGWRAWDGAEMLLRQAAASFRCWTGLEPPLHIMRRALDATAGH